VEVPHSRVVVAITAVVVSASIVTVTEDVIATIIVMVEVAVYDTVDVSDYMRVIVRFLVAVTIN
jgi:hypothetical protein